MEKRINNFLLFIALFILYAVLFSPLVISILLLLGIDVEHLPVHTQTIYLIVIDIALMIITYYIFRKDINREFFKYGRHFFKYFSFGFKWWLIGLVLMITSNILIGAIYPSATATNEEAFQTLFKSSPIYMTFSACLYAPFMEEMIFRKSLKKVFNSNTVFIIISGLLFGLAHNLGVIGKLDMIYIIPYALFGCVFAYMYVKTNDIFVSITFHFVHNTITILYLLYQTGVLF